MSTKGIVCGAFAVVAIVVIMTIEKPKFAYDSNGNPKSFGLSNDDSTTVMPTWLLAILAGSGVYALEIM